MTTASKTGLGLRWWQYLGPWPLRPLLTIVFAGLFTNWATASVATSQNGGHLVQAVVQEFPGTAVSTIAAGVVLMVAAKRRRPYSLATYLLVLAAAAVADTIVHSIVSPVARETLESLGPVVVTIPMRVFVLLVVVQATAGITALRLQRQVDATQEALAFAREQQQLLLEADEQVRRQIAETLHDRVQAGLITACLELQEMRDGGRTDPAALNSIIRRLEDLRRLDVRNAARTLSPSLAEVGLLQALEELAAQYPPAMTVELRVDPEIDRAIDGAPESMLLGCYRIVEQSLLNAAVHGSARHCAVTVAVKEGAVVVTIADDGRGILEADPEAGVGWTLTTTWVRVLGGTWDWTTGPQGTTVHAELPRP